jgi:hypothetical protein
MKCGEEMRVLKNCPKDQVLRGWLFMGDRTHWKTLEIWERMTRDSVDYTWKDSANKERFSDVTLEIPCRAKPSPRIEAIPPTSDRSTETAEDLDTGTRAGAGRALAPMAVGGFPGGIPIELFGRSSASGGGTTANWAFPVHMRLKTEIPSRDVAN